MKDVTPGAPPSPMDEDMPPPPPLPGLFFFRWESATHVAEEAEPGLLPASASLPLTALVMGVVITLLWPVMGGYSLLAGLVFGRLVALEATSYTLPNVYTVPLLLAGWVHAAQNGRLLAAWGLFLGLTLLGSILSATRFRAGFGGGDLKLLAALFAFLPLPTGLFAMAIGCGLWMPVAFATPRAKVPLGIPVIMGWVIMLAYGGALTQALQGLISRHL